MQTNKQIELADQYINNTNVSLFLTGKAGTGKTTFLHHIVKTVNKRCVVLAPTGVAAVNAGGVTIHSFFQLPLCPYLPDVPELVTEYQLPEQQRKLRKEKMSIIKTLDLLIIDEISMVRADLLDAVDNTLQRYRRNSKPFGGVQLLMIGDVQQLSPVVKDDEKEYLSRVYSSPFFFHSKVLQRLHYITIELTTIYRQQNKDFVELLNHIRDGVFDLATLQALNQRCDPTFNPKDEEHYIRLTTHNRQANIINAQKMDALQTELYTFEADIEGNFPESSAATDVHLQLKVGEQVMFVRNDSSPEHKYYNGKIATIEAIDEDDGIVVVDEEGNHIDVGRERWESVKYEIDPTSNQIKQNVEGSFIQYPLKAAWAMTIHKAQGLTFDRVIIDVGEAFTYGQVYVALSRCRTLEGLILSSPITPDCAFDSADIAKFNSTFSDPKQIEIGLENHKKQYYYDVLFELFDFSAIQHSAEKINRIYQDHLRTLYPSQAQKISNICCQSLTDLLSVAEKFHNQLGRIMRESGDVEDALLKERVQKALEYFAVQLTAIEGQIAPLLLVEITNKEVLKDFQGAVEQYENAIGLTLCLQKMMQIQGFSVANYLKAKTDYLLNGDDAKRDKKKKKSPLDLATIYSNNAHPQLVVQLSQWRKEKYEELSIAAFKVLTQKTLLAIADKLPKNEEELLAISGMSKAKVRSWGKEILHVIGQYCDNEGIKFYHIPEQFVLGEDMKEDTKQPSWTRSAELFAEGKTINEIAVMLGRTVATIENHIFAAVQAEALDADLVLSSDEMDLLVEYFMEEKPEKLTEVYEHFEEKFSYLKLRVARWFASTL